MEILVFKLTQRLQILMLGYCFLLLLDKLHRSFMRFSLIILVIITFLYIKIKLSYWLAKMT